MAEAGSLRTVPHRVASFVRSRVYRRAIRRRGSRRAHRQKKPWKFGQPAARAAAGRKPAATTRARKPATRRFSGGASPRGSRTSACARRRGRAASSAGSWAPARVPQTGSGPPRRGPAGRPRVRAPSRRPEPPRIRSRLSEIVFHQPQSSPTSPRITRRSMTSGSSESLQREGDEQAQTVVEVLGVELDDLQLGEQEVGGAERVGHDRRALRRTRRCGTCAAGRSSRRWPGRSRRG